MDVHRQSHSVGRWLVMVVALGVGLCFGLATCLEVVGPLTGAEAAAPVGTLPPIPLNNPYPYFGIGNPTPIAVAANLPPDPVNGGGCPNCAMQLQRYWASIEAQGTRPRDGEFYNARWLGGYSGGCPGVIDTRTPNPVYTPLPGGGYNYRIHLDPQVPAPIEVYVYDPAQYYRRLMPGNTPTDPDTNDQEPCQDFLGTNAYRYETTYTLYYPDNTPNNFDDDVPVPGGSRTFEDRSTLPNPHNKWFRVGTVAYNPLGDYRLQVRTEDPNQLNSHGVGQNQYALALGGPRAPTNVEQISPVNTLSVFNNLRDLSVGAVVEWYIAYIPMQYAGERFSIRGFDPGDATCPTYIQVWQVGDTQPTDFDLNWSGQILNTLQTTTAGGQKPYDGQWVTLGVRVPPPPVYQGTWWKIRYIVGSGCGGTSTDRTLWEIAFAPDLTATATPSPTNTAPATVTSLPTGTPMPTFPPTGTPTIIGSTTTPTATPCAIAFTDVDQNHPFYGFIRCLACRGVVAGYGDGTFRPGNEVTRGQLAKILANAAGLSNAIPSTQQTFSDVPPPSPFWLWIERLAGVGAISGYACGGVGEPCDPQQRPYFRSGSPATRGQISKITALTAGWNGPIPTTQQTFTDVPPNNPFWLWIEELAGRGIISGYACGGPGEPCDPAQRAYFRWGANTTRGQMSKIAANTFFPGCQTPARRE